MIVNVQMMSQLRDSNIFTVVYTFKWESRYNWANNGVSEMNQVGRSVSITDCILTSNK